MEDNKLEAILKMMDVNSEEVLLEHMNNMAKVLCNKLNKENPPKQEGCIWDIRFINYGGTLRVAKMMGEKEVCFMTVDMSTYEVFMSIAEDEDLRRMKLAMAYAIMMGQI